MPVVRTLARTTVVAAGLVAGFGAAPGAYANDVQVGPAYADVSGSTVSAGAAVVYGGVHEAVTVSPSDPGTRTCAGALLAGGCTTTSGSDASGFANADLLLYGGGVTYSITDGGVVVCNSTVYGVCVD